MIESLSRLQCEQLLASQLIGRIGCHSSGKLYIVPITYAFHEGYIYAHSNEGLKIKMMRKNPKVCFEVECVENMGNWRTVILWGKYEELKTQLVQAKAINILHERFAPFHVSESVRPHPYTHAPDYIEKERKAVVYRILIEDITGKYEKTN
jgi:nitroimidazol reductase NimA-like FMN-containing flavoprotein (pyridoxamine 5'-phosphate oxidase superfamily)